ncbi:uncharacterized protein LOC143231400 [Tachypleus tridentatus]|uniref:uncharacterized protein LOC143231400 n=1 Tax=Tachypleus tridentatus TaxID=6853 RepID=UPI003FD48B17
MSSSREANQNSIFDTDRQKNILGVIPNLTVIPPPFLTEYSLCLFCFFLLTVLPPSQTLIPLPSFKATWIGKSVSSSTPTEILQVISLKTCTNECLKTNCKAFSFQTKVTSSNTDRICQIVKEFHSWNTTDDFLEDDDTFIFYEILPKWNVYETTPYEATKPYGARIIRKPTNWWSYSFSRSYHSPRILEENDIVISDFCLDNTHFNTKNSAYFVGIFRNTKLLLRFKIFTTSHVIDVFYETSLNSQLQKVHYDSSTYQGKMIQPGYCYHATIHLAPNETTVTLNGVMLTQFSRYYHPSEVNEVKIHNRDFHILPSTTVYIL